MKRSRFLCLGILLVLAALSITSTNLRAQQATDLFIPWHHTFNVPQLGQGVEVDPTKVLTHGSSPVATRDRATTGFKPTIGAPNSEIHTQELWYDGVTSIDLHTSAMGEANAFLSLGKGLKLGGSGSLSGSMQASSTTEMPFTGGRQAWITGQTFLPTTLK